MTAKTHYLDSPEPIEQGRDLVAHCGAPIHKAAAVRLEPGEAIANCRRCNDAKKHPRVKQRYGYLVWHGQSAHDEEIA